MVVYYPKAESDDMNGKMRDATPEERASVNAYIKSISKPTGIKFGALEQDPKTGHWITENRLHPKCDQCGWEYGSSITKFCPDCGARMIEPQETKQPEISSYYGLKSYVREGEACNET